MVAVKGRCPFAKLYTKVLSTGDVPRLLSDSEISNRLKKLKGWKHEGNFATKSFEFRNFIDGIRFVESVAKTAEKEEHHPDIHVRYKTVTLSVQTHSEGGVTEWDLKLVEAIERVLRERTTRNATRR